MDYTILVLCIVIIAIFILTILALITGFLLFTQKKPDKPVPEKKVSVSIFNTWVDHNIKFLVSRGYVKDVNKTLLKERRNLLLQMESVLDGIRSEDDAPVAVLIKNNRGGR